jgi:hypothetical protein
MITDKEKSDKKREALIFISFIDLLVVAIFIVLAWASMELAPVYNNIRPILDRAFGDDKGLDEKEKKLKEMKLLENLEQLSPEALKYLANLNRDQLGNVDQLFANLSADEPSKLNALVQSFKGGRSAIPYPEESEPIATLTIMNGTSQFIDEIKLKWSDLRPRFKSILEKYQRYPEEEDNKEYSYDEYVDIYEAIFNNEFNEDKKKLNGLYRHKIRVIVTDEAGNQVNARSIDKARVFRLLNSFYLVK